jgi:hypothetical protein
MMRSLGTRRVALLAGAATAAAVALTGCSAGQTAETSLKRPSNQGVNTQTASGSVLIRDLAINYDGVNGYEPGSDAPIQVALFNETKSEVTVQVSSAPPTEDAPAAGQVTTATSVALVGGVIPADSAASASPSDSASASPSDSASADPSASASTDPSPAPANQQASFTIEPMGTVTFLSDSTPALTAIGLSGKLVPGDQLNLVFKFSDGSPDLSVLTPIATPLTPAPRASGNPDENTEG